MKSLNHNRLLILIAIIFIAVLSRLLPHPNNFTPLMAIGLLSGLFIDKKILAFFIPLFSMLISDLIIGFYPFFIAIYLSILAPVAIGILFRNRNKLSDYTVSLILGSTSFFLLSNLTVWLFSGWYSMNIEGLINCYALAIPFYKNQVAADIIYFIPMLIVYKFVESKFTKSISMA